MWEVYYFTSICFRLCVHARNLNDVFVSDCSRVSTLRRLFRMFVWLSFRNNAIVQPVVRLFLF